jgi:hypothetical protein
LKTLFSSLLKRIRGLGFWVKERRRRRRRRRKRASFGCGKRGFPHGVEFVGAGLPGELKSAMKRVCGDTDSRSLLTLVVGDFWRAQKAP